MIRTQNKASSLSSVSFATVIRIAWPAVLENFFLELAGMIDTFMVSGLGETAVAAVGLTSQPKFLGLSLFFAMNIALSAIVARRKGEENRAGANEAFALALLLTVVFGIIITLLTVGFAPQIISFCGSNEETHPLAVTYYRYIMGGMMFNILSMVINSAHRGAGNTRIAFYSNTISSITNIVFNYLLIGGHCGFPAWGIRGAAIATVLGTVVSFVLLFISLFGKTSYISLAQVLKSRISQFRYVLKTIARLSSSTLTEQILMRIGFMLTAIMAADMGTSAMAAHQVGMNCLGLSFSFGNGMQAAAVTLIGQCLGRKEPENAKRYGWVCQKIGLALALMMSLIYLFGGKLIFRIFFTEEEVVHIGVGLSRILIVVVLFQITQVIFNGCLRGAGDVLYTMIMSVICVTIIRSAVSYICGYPLGMGIYGIWMGILADQFSRLLFGFFRFRGNKWLKITF